MESIGEIRKLFKPIQPSVGAYGAKVVYQENSPAPQLQNFIHCYWTLSTKKTLQTPFNYRVVSDGCIDVVFNLKNPKESFVMGFHNKSTGFDLGKAFSYGGIRFYPSIFPALFETSAKTLTNKEQRLQIIFPALAEFLAATVGEGFSGKFPDVNQFFITYLQSRKPQLEERFFAAFIDILKQRGNLEIGKDIKTGLSPRQLRRFFNYYIGTSPKSFCQVVRFQCILNAMLASEGQVDHKVFFDVGFFDQAHFIKNFTRFYGITPSKAFR
jgi:hypothetical protein